MYEWWFMGKERIIHDIISRCRTWCSRGIWSLLNSPEYSCSWLFRDPRSVLVIRATKLLKEARGSVPLPLIDLSANISHL
jgi:hypothetical protein